MKILSCGSTGQALPETMLVLPLLVIVACLIAWSARVFITRQQLVMAARYGTDMIVHTNMDERRIRREIRNFLSDKRIEGRRLDPARLTDERIRVRIARLPRFTDATALERCGELLAPASRASSVEISYEFDLPGIFAAWRSYLDADGLPETLSIGARAEVLAGTGCSWEGHYAAQH